MPYSEVQNPHRMKALLILSLLMYCEAKPQNAPSDSNKNNKDLSGSCSAARDLGVNLEGFPKHVAHNLHSITLQDIQFFFEPNFPEDNDIPTVNQDLTSDQEILWQAPSRSSVYKFPSGAAFDFILMNSDNVDSLMEKSTSSLEKMSHAIHMQEMWYKVSLRYKKLENTEIDLDQVCPCLVDEKSNEIINKLEDIAIDLRKDKEVIMFEFPDKELHDFSGETENQEQRTGKAMAPHSRGYQRTGKAMAPHSRGYQRTGKAMAPHSRGYDGYLKRKRRSIMDTPSSPQKHAQDGKALIDDDLIPSPELTDSKSWEFWKKNVDAPMNDEEMEYSAALYFKCKMHQYQ